MTLENGKALADSKAEITYGAEFFRWFSEEAVRIAGRWSVAPNGASRLLTMRQPVGPCLFVTPWNFPLAMGTRKIGPAIAAGCTMVVKPARSTPLSMLVLAEILTEAGLPDGVLNVITTSTTGKVVEPIIRDPRLRKLSFTGSTEVGRSLIEQSAEQLLRVSMELGGNAPFVVFGDADVDAAMEGAMVAKMRNGGEACTSANRFLVHESVVDEFSSKLTERMGSMTVGRGTDDGVEVGPLVDSDTRDKVAELVDDATGKGAEVLTGGEDGRGTGATSTPRRCWARSPATPGCSRRRSSARWRRSPPSPPTRRPSPAPTTPSSGWCPTSTPATSTGPSHVCEAIQSGMVGLNTGLVSNPAAPFGGIKHSGFGREGGAEGIDEYLETKYVGIAR